VTDRAEQAFAEFVSAWERDEHPDPAAAVAAVPAGEREPAAAMIAAYLSAHTREHIPEEDVRARATRPESAPPVEWSELLPALRARTGITRGVLVARLAADLGHPEAASQVEEHVHALETGQLQPRRVRPRVVAVLARIFGVPADMLELARRAAPRVTFADQRIEAFARSAPLIASEPRPGAAEPRRPRDPEIDDLFTGGG
jgi:hypothetical protein